MWLEGDAGEVAAPAHGDGEAAKRRQEDVAACLPEAKALGREFPDTVDTVRMVGLAKRIFERDLSGEGTSGRQTAVNFARVRELACRTTPRTVFS